MGIVINGYFYQRTVIDKPSLLPYPTIRGMGFMQEERKLMKRCMLITAALMLGLAVQAGGVRGAVEGREGSFIESGTVKLYYEEAGSGRPIVMIHGGLLNAAMWDDQFEEFARRYRVIRYDARRHGCTVSEPDTFSHHEDLRALVEALGLEKPVIMGLSMGGYVAIDFALEYPEMVGALVLAAPGLSGYEFKGEEFEQFMARLREAAERDDVEAYIEAFQTAWTDGPRRKPGEVDAAVREKVRRMALENAQRWDEFSVEYRPLPLAIERLDGIRVPVLALVGDLDMPGILEIVDLVESTVPGARKVVIPGAAHMINMEKPAEFNRIVLEFLEGL
jgi:3-oxoadipate enol-lactonase